MIRVYLARHGLAMSDRFLPVEVRPLSAKGRRRARKTAAAFARLGETVDSVYTSPYVCAVQSAEILADASGTEQVRVLDELRPTEPAERLLRSVSRLVGDGKGVLLIGHEPQLSAIAALLFGLEPSLLRFRRGAIARVDVESLTPGTAAEPRWWLRPKTAGLEGGAPLREPG